MTLAAWQASLAELVIAHASETQAAWQAGLSDVEKAWLQQLQPTRGFRMTCEVQRWWREFRVQMAAPLTLSVLDAKRRAALVDEYVRRYPRPSSFFLREALPFLDLAVELASDVAHLRSLAQFERAMLEVGEALASGEFQDVADDLHPTDAVAPHPLADVIPFEARPERVLAAAWRGIALPQVTQRHYWLLVAPRLPNLARACTDVEASLFLSLRDSAAQVERLNSRPQTAESLTGLWHAGALRRR